MQESFTPFTEQSSDANSFEHHGTFTMGVGPFFSMRKVRLIYNELIGSSGFEFANFDAFKHQVLNSAAPQVELNKWQAIAARR